MRLTFLLGLVTGAFFVLANLRIAYFQGVKDLPNLIQQSIAEHGLPGEDAHQIMAPLTRARSSEMKQADYNPKQSAVMLLLYPTQSSWESVLIERPQYSGTHSGQIAFPGGKVEPNDLNLEHTAKRETEEEVGVRQDSIQIIQSLTEVYIPPSNFMVYPFIGVLNEAPTFIPDPLEVASIITYPIELLQNDAIVSQKKIKLSNSLVMNTPYFEIDGHTVWGATAVMLSEFKELLKRLK